MDPLTKETEKPSVCAYMPVCMCMCVCVCMCVCMCACVSACTHVCVHVCVHACIHVHVGVFCMHAICLLLHIHIKMCTHAHCFLVDIGETDFVVVVAV